VSVGPPCKEDGCKLLGFERILRMIYGPVNDNGIWKIGHNIQLYSLHDELDPSRQLAVLKPEGTRRVENLRLDGLSQLRKL
jgi:hypothetical protein